MNALGERGKGTSLEGTREGRERGRRGTDMGWGCGVSRE